MMNQSNDRLVVPDGDSSRNEIIIDSFQQRIDDLEKELKMLKDVQRT
jgi:hypothetical protein